MTYDSTDKLENTGDFCFVDGEMEIVGMSFRCPCGCGNESYISVDPLDVTHWAWNGKLEQATLTPSLQQVGGCEWHGYLTNGEWKSV